jgi:arsenate reductase (thioredoxin)
MHMPTRIAFICVHNSCRSQISEALGNSLSNGSFTCYSAGSDPSESIDSDAIRHMKDLYGIDIGRQHTKSISELPSIDILVTMGCGITCPTMRSEKKIYWNIPDPKGLPDEEYKKIIKMIEENLKGMLASEDLRDL